MTTLEQSFQEFIDFALPTFKNATEFSSLEKLKEEIMELECEINNKSGSKFDELDEYVDCIMCILHSMAKRGFTVDMLKIQFQYKLAINQSRKWKEKSNKTYSHE